MWLVNSVKGAFGYGDLEVVQTGESDPKAEHNASAEEKQGLFKQLSGYIGKDVTSMISLPVWLFEPISFLQVLAEPMQYGDLLFKAADAPDPVNRLGYLTTWIVTGYSCAVRTKKPFNPFLGETFEYVAADKKFRVFGEQTSHHPPISVIRIEAEGLFTLTLEMELHTKFRGNSSDVMVHGTNEIVFHKFNETIRWGHMQTSANNVIIGGMWVDHFGEITINSPSGAKAVLKQTQCGWLGSGRYDMTADIFDAAGKLRLKLSGKWNDAITATKIADDGTAAEQGGILWKRPEQKFNNKWGFSPFVESLNALTPELEKTLPQSDSRRRTDRKALEQENEKLAGEEKNRLEEVQRALRKEREASGVTFEPKYFKRVELPAGSEFAHRIEYTNDYWKERAERLGETDAVADSVAKLSVKE